MTGHLEPRDHPEQDNRVISDSRWENLLWYGHTYDNDDPVMSWTRVDENDGLPDELVRRKRDAELKNTVIDYPSRQILADKLRKAIHRCHGKWEEWERKNHVPEEDRDEVGKIKENLKKKKVILYDEKGSDYVLEQTPADTPEYANWQLDKTQNKYCKNQNPENEELIQLQKEIYVLTQFLVLPQILDKPISTKGRSIKVALA